jgi:hypothetical protein
MPEQVFISGVKNQVVVNSPGPQGPAGRTILNGSGAPSNNLGTAGDFYYDIVTTKFYGPKLNDLSWSNAQQITLVQTPGEFAFSSSWSLQNLVLSAGVYSIEITHNLGFSPNVTVKASSGDILETEVDYNSLNKITLRMAQPFSGTAYLS